MKLTEQTHALLRSLQQAERQAKQLLKDARAQRLSFGLTYNYLDEDIAHLIGLARYMDLLTQQHATRQASPQRSKER
jgi:hypothetical protein